MINKMNVIKGIIEDLMIEKLNKGLTLEYKKKIPPIGQGGFILHEVGFRGERYNIIYDCGTKSPRKFLEEELKKIKKFPTILVISHFHDDHINCVKMLKNYKVNVVKVIIPKIDPMERVLSIAPIEDDEVRRFAFKPGDVFTDAEVIEISYERAEQNQRTIRSRDESSNERYHGDDHDISKHNGYPWRLRFYVDNRFSLKLSSDKIEFINGISTYDELNDNLNILRKYYREAELETINYTSMMMLCYTDVHEIRLMNEMLMCTGDIKINDETIKNGIINHYDDQKFMITEFMVPHHAAAGYFCCNPFPFARRAFAQTGKFSIHNHPTQELKDYLENVGVEFYNITPNEDK